MISWIISGLYAERCQSVYHHFILENPGGVTRKTARNISNNKDRTQALSRQLTDIFKIPIGHIKIGFISLNETHSKIEIRVVGVPVYDVDDVDDEDDIIKQR